jgi:hypothetical protein
MVIDSHASQLERRVLFWQENPSWAYLPMESDRMFYLRRVSAILHGSFRPLMDIEDEKAGKGSKED